MSIAIKGLRVKPNYEGLINVAVSDKLYNVKFPNRGATFFTKWVCFNSIRWRRHEGYAITRRTSHGRIA